MARIRIEDLPEVDNLTQEEMEQILGAGLRSFKPTFEALEAREVCDVGFNHALLSSAAQPQTADGPQTHMVRELGPRVEVDMSLLYGASARGAAPQGQAGAAALSPTTTTWQDVDFIKDKAQQIVEGKVIKASSPWAVNPYLRVTGVTEGAITLNQIEVKVRVLYKTPGNGLGNTGGQAEGTFTLNFFRTRQGDMKVYTLGSPSHHNFEHGKQLIDLGALNDKLAAVCKSEVIRMDQRWDSSHGEYDGGQVARRVTDWAVKALTKHGTDLTVQGITHHPDGIKVQILVKRRLEGAGFSGPLERVVTFDLTYAGQVNGKDQFNVQVTSNATPNDWFNGRYGLDQFGVTEQGLQKELTSLVNQ